MAVKIRLTRIGRHEDPFYRVVVADSRSARDKRFIEELGHYDPSLGKQSLVNDEEKVLFWLSKGAKPSDTVKSLLSSKGLIQKHAESKSKAAKKETK